MALHAPNRTLVRPAQRASAARQTFAVVRGSGPRAPPDDAQIGASLCRTGPLYDVECRDRTTKSLQLKVSEILQSRNRFDGASDAAADQDLPVLRLSTQPCSEVAYRPDRGVTGAFRKPDLAQRGVALRDADAKPKFTAVAAPSRE